MDRSVREADWATEHTHMHTYSQIKLEKKKKKKNLKKQKYKTNFMAKYFAEKWR